MRIAIDLDGTICSVKKPQESYIELQPLPGAVERIRALRGHGQCLIILTARNMATCEDNLGRVMKNVGKITLDWLEQHGVEYDEIYFGKPNAEVYLGDRGIRFTDWSLITDEIIAQEARTR